MKTRILTTTIAICLLPVVHLCAQSASPLLVTATDPSDSELTLQQNDSTNTKMGDLTLAYKYSGGKGLAFFEISNPNGDWSWRKNADGSFVEQMWLGDNGTLKLKGTQGAGQCHSSRSIRLPRALRFRTRMAF